MSLKPKYLRKVIRIRAEDSPNVQLGLWELKNGLDPSYEQLVPGMLDFAEYQYRRKVWDPIRQCIGLDGMFYEGAEVLLFPPLWLNKAEEVARTLDPNRPANTIGVDTAEGGDSTVMTAIDTKGIVEQVSLKTPDTSVIPGMVIAFWTKHGVKPQDVWFDQGGGGGVHVDTLRKQGHNVQEVFFGEPVSPDPVRFVKPWNTKMDERRDRYNYKNRRAQMYHMIRLRLDPTNNEQVFGIPAELTELRRQLAPIPLDYDQEGRVYLLPKRPAPGAEKGDKPKSLMELIGCSPDEADSLALAVYGLAPDSKAKVIRPMF